LLTKRDFSGSLKIGNVLNVKSCPNIRKGSVDRGVPSAVRMSFLVRRFFMTLAWIGAHLANGKAHDRFWWFFFRQRVYEISAVFQIREVIGATVLTFKRFRLRRFSSVTIGVTCSAHCISPEDCI